MTKTVSTSKKPRKQHSPEFRSEALKLAERIGVTAAARELSLYESQLYNWRSKQQNVNWRCLPRLHVSNASWQNGMKSWLSSKRPRHTSRSA
ncbi:transposase [Escherichia coli]|nr:transposase [Escherichia coli]